MSDAFIGTNDAKTVKLWMLRNEQLYRDYPKETVFGPYMGKGDNVIVKENEDLTSKKGDEITFGLLMRNTEGFLPSGTQVDKNENTITTFTDKVTVDEKNFGIKPSADSPITIQRLFYDPDQACMQNIKTQFAENMEKELVTALDSANTTIAYQASGDFKLTATAATAKAALTAADIFNPNLFVSLKPCLKTGFSRKQPSIPPLKIDGQEYWVVMYHPDCMADAEKDPTIVQAQREAMDRGKTNPLFQNASMIYRGFIFIPNENISIASDGGSGSDVPYAKCHVLGKDALLLGWAKKPTLIKKSPAYPGSGQDDGWGMFSMFGITKAQFNSKDYGAVNLYMARNRYSDIAYS